MIATMITSRPALICLLTCALLKASPATAAIQPANSLDPAGDWSHQALQDIKTPSLFEAMRAPGDKDYRKLGAADRPVGHPLALWLGIAALLALAGALSWRRREHLRRWLEEQRTTPGRLRTAARRLKPVAPVLLLAAVARLATLGLRPMLEDEWTNVETIGLLDVLFHGYEVLTNPPGLAAVEHAFYAISLNPWWYRLPVAFSGVLLVWATWRLVRRLCGDRAALLAAGLCAVHPGLIVWSQTVRGYVPAAALVLLALDAGLATARGGRDRHAVAFWAWAVAACWTHYTAVFALAAVTPMLLWHARRDRSALRRLWLASGGAMIAFIPLLPWVLADVAHKQGSGWMPDYFGLAVAFVTGAPLGLGWLALLIAAVGRPWQDDGGRWLLALTAVLLVAQLATTPVVYQTPPYLAAATACLLGLVATAARRLGAGGRRRQRHIGFAMLLLPPALTTAALDLAPLNSPIGADIVQPYLLRARGHARFAERVRQIRLGLAPGPQCANVVMARPPEREVWLYHLGPLTQQDLGADPFSEHHGTIFRLALQGPAGKRALDLREPDRRDLPKVGSLQATLDAQGCFFWIASFQHCERRRGLFYDSASCRWLDNHCWQVDDIANEELWYCARDAGAG